MYNYNQSFYEKLDKDHAGLMRYQNLLFIMIALTYYLLWLSYMKSYVAFLLSLWDKVPLKDISLYKKNLS